MYLVDRGKIYANDIRVGVGVTIEDNVTIGNPDKPIEELVIGDHVFIGRDSVLQTKNLTIKDYTKIHNHAFVFGRNDGYIGYNCWFGQGCILDAEGGFHFGDGLGAGAYSQLWSHIRHGDVGLAGCKYLSFGKLITEPDVWFVGHCIVSPIVAKSFSMAMVGSVVTKDMEYNHIYGGAPAKDLTDKLGAPYDLERTTATKKAWMEDRLTVFLGYHSEVVTGKIKIVEEINPKDDAIQFDVCTRTYTKHNDPDEVAFMKYLLPEAKFTPSKWGMD